MSQRARRAVGTSYIPEIYREDIQESSQPKETRQENKKQAQYERNFNRVCALVAVIAIVACGCFLLNRQGRITSYQHDANELQTRIETLQNDNNNLEVRLALLERDNGRILEEAKKLGMVEPQPEDIHVIALHSEMSAN